MIGDIRINRAAPGFKLTGVYQNEFKVWNLSELRGQWVVLLFYQADFVASCQRQILSFNQQIAAFQQLGAQILACSTDSQHSHKAWAESLGGLALPLLADVHHTVAIDYNVFVEEEATCQSGVFVLNPESLLKWYQISDSQVLIDVDEVLRVLKILTQKT